MIFGHVEAYGGQRTHGCHDRQLRGAHLDGDDIKVVMHHRIDKRAPNVARGHSSQPSSTQHCFEHERGRRLTVGPGDTQPRGRVGLAQPPGEFELAPDVDPARLSINNQW